MNPEEGFPIYRVTSGGQDGRLDLVTFLSPDEISAIGGLPLEGVVGRVSEPGGELVPENFTPNRVFVQFVHALIKRVAPQIPGAVLDRGGPWSPVLDGRAFPDIIGSFEKRDGEIVPSSYTANPRHQILSENGMFRPHPEIQVRLLGALREVRLSSGVFPRWAFERVVNEPQGEPWDTPGARTEIVDLDILQLRREGACLSVIVDEDEDRTFKIEFRSCQAHMFVGGNDSRSNGAREPSMVLFRHSPWVLDVACRAHLHPHPHRLKHYRLSGSDQVLDVMSEEPPIITEVEGEGPWY